MNIGETLRKTLLAICIIVAIGSMAAIVYIGYGYWRAAGINTQAREQFLQKTVDISPIDEEIEAPAPVLPPEVDFPALLDESPDAVAWLWIGEISYPVVQGTDNERYLRTAYNGEKSIAGSIFMDYRNQADLSDANTIIYGHNMKDGSMFGKLKSYRQKDFADSHQDIYLITAQGAAQYRVFAVYETNASDSLCYQRTFKNEEQHAKAVSYAMTRSEVAMETNRERIQNFLTLSTCTANDTERFIVNAYFMGWMDS